MTKIRNMPVLRTYCTYKTSFGYELFLDYVHIHSLRFAMAKYRLSRYDLSVEKGRHHKPKTPIQGTICNYCNLNQIRDEVNLLLYTLYMIKKEQIYLAFVI